MKFSFWITDSSKISRGRQGATARGAAALKYEGLKKVCDEVGNTQIFRP